MTAFERLVDKLRDEGRHVKESGTSKAMAQCPAHEDRVPSLSLTGIEGQALVYCHGGCQTEDVLATLGMTAADLYDEPNPSRMKGIQAHAVYRYPDDRLVIRSADKKFRQSGNTKGDALFREIASGGGTVYLVEGEKDVLALEAVGVTATTGAQGAKNIDKANLSPLHGHDVVAVVDKGDAGKKWAAIVKEKLDGKAKSLVFAEAKTGEDSADHIAAGHGVEEFVELEVEESNPLRRARITWASHIEPEPVVWAWETDDVGRIPAGSLSIAAGREGTGKSSFGIWQAAHITKGTLPGAYYGTPRRVFYVAVEDSWKHTLVPRLMAAGADLSMIGRFEVVSMDEDELTLSLPADNALLEREVRRHDIALVVIDPLMSAIGEKIDTHREREVRSALDPLAKIADRTNSIFLGIAHFNKGGGSDAASLITGSGAFKNVPRSVFGFARDETDETGSRVMSQVKNSLGRDDLPSLSYVIESAEVQTRKGIAITGKFSFTGESDRSVAEIIRDARRDPDDVEEAKDAASWIHGYLEQAGGEAPAKDVIAAGKAVGHVEKTLKNARKKVADTSRSGFGTDGVWTWVLRIGTPVGPEGPTDQRPGPSVSMGGPTDGGGPSKEGGRDDEGGPPGDEGHGRPTPLVEDQGATNGRVCAYCGEPVEPGQVRHAACYWEALQRDRIEKATEKARRSA